MISDQKSTKKWSKTRKITVFRRSGTTFWTKIWSTLRRGSTFFQKFPVFPGPEKSAKNGPKNRFFRTFEHFSTRGKGGKSAKKRSFFGFQEKNPKNGQKVDFGGSTKTPKFLLKNRTFLPGPKNDQKVGTSFCPKSDFSLSTNIR